MIEKTEWDGCPCKECPNKMQEAIYYIVKKGVETITIPVYPGEDGFGIVIIPLKKGGGDGK